MGTFLENTIQSFGSPHSIFVVSFIVPNHHIKLAALPCQYESLILLTIVVILPCRAFPLVEGGVSRSSSWVSLYELWNNRGVLRGLCLQSETFRPTNPYNVCGSSLDPQCTMWQTNTICTDPRHWQSNYPMWGSTSLTIKLPNVTIKIMNTKQNTFFPSRSPRHSSNI